MFQSPGGVLALDPVAVSQASATAFAVASLSSTAATGPPAGARSGSFFRRSHLATQPLGPSFSPSSPQSAMQPVTPGGSADGGGRAVYCEPALGSPRRGDHGRAAAPVPASMPAGQLTGAPTTPVSPLMTRRGSAMSPLAVRVSRGELDLADGDVGPPEDLEDDDTADQLPSMVPDVHSPVRRLASVRSRRALVLPSPAVAPGSPRLALRNSGGGGAPQLGGAEVLPGRGPAAAAGAGDIWPRELPSGLPGASAVGGTGGGSRGTGAVRNLRASSVVLVAGAPALYSPTAIPGSGGGPAVAAGSEVPSRSPPSSSAAARRVALLGPSTAGGSGGGSVEDDRAGGGAAQKQQQPWSPGAEAFGGDVAEGLVQQRGSVFAWGPSADSAPGSFAGNRGAPAGRSLDAGASGSASPRKPPHASASGSIGFSRRPEDLPAAPNPANSRSLAAGGGSGGSHASTPGTPGSRSSGGTSMGGFFVGAGFGGGGGLLASGPPSGRPAALLSSQNSGASVGFSRRLEDLPAAPSPSHSRSLAGAGGGGRSGGSTPASPGQGGGGGGGGGTVHGGLVRMTAAEQDVAFAARKTSGGGYVQDAAPTRAALISVTSWRDEPSAAPTAATSGGPAPHPPGGSATFSGEYPGGGGRAHIGPSPAGQRLSVGGGGASASVSSPGCAPPSPRPGAGILPQLRAETPAAQAGIGFSRRLEDLPAAPSPSHSRSLAGPGGSSAGSSTRSPAGGASDSATSLSALRGWTGAMDSPRAPASPASNGSPGASGGPGAGSVGLSRRSEDLPAAPSPGAARSLRPESSRTAFRSHANTGTGSIRGSGGGGEAGIVSVGIPGSPGAAPAAAFGRVSGGPGAGPYPAGSSGSAATAAAAAAAAAGGSRGGMPWSVQRSPVPPQTQRRELGGGGGGAGANGGNGGGVRAGPGVIRNSFEDDELEEELAL